MTSGIVNVMRDASDYARRKAWIAEYFDRTAAARWAQLTSDAPVGRVRAGVRAARARMQATLSHWMPADLTGVRVLDAGCGTGLLSIELAERGANVVAIDLSPTLVNLARERAPQSLRDRLDFRSGDMSDPTLGTFDYVVAMDSVIHYRAPEMLSVVGAFAQRARKGVLFTVVPRTPLLTVMLAIGRAFPRGSRSPSVEPVSDDVFTNGLKTFATGGWHLKRVERVSAGFYTSQACELIKQEVAS